MICPICQQPSTGTVRINDGYSARHCRNCDFLMTDVETSSLRVNEETYRLKDRILTYYLREKEFEQRYDAILGLLRRYAHIGSLLEVGSNIGVFADLARRRGVRVDSVELNEECRTFQRLAYHIDAVNDLTALAGRTYDAIVLMDVLEHIPGPVEYLRHLKEFLSEDGVIFLQFPNKNSMAARIAGECWGWWAAPDHLSHFSTSAVRGAAAQSGLRVVLLRCVSPVLDDLGMIPILRHLFPPLRALARWVDTNPMMELRGGSLIQALLGMDDKMADAGAAGDPSPLPRPQAPDGSPSPVSTVHRVS